MGLRERIMPFSHRIEGSVYGVKILINKGKFTLIQVFIPELVGRYANAGLFVFGRI